MSKSWLGQVISNYLVWFVSVCSAARGDIAVGFVIALFLSLLQAGFFLRHHRGQADQLLRFVLGLTMIGLCVDTLWLRLGVVRFNANPFMAYAPLWMWGIWLNFSVTIFCCLQSWFRRYRWLVPLALAGFAAAYYSGSALGAAILPHGLISLSLIAAGYAVLVPLFLWWFSVRYL